LFSCRSTALALGVLEPIKPSLIDERSKQPDRLQSSKSACNPAAGLQRQKGDGKSLYCKK
jgi:hypothetical protein